MIHILTSGLAILTLGLNLMMVWKMLTITNEIAEEAVVKMKKVGKVVTIGGSVVIIIGLVSFFLAKPSEGSAIVAAGGYIAVLGLLWKLRVIGRGHEGCVRDGAWFVAGVGFGLILAYVIAVYVIR